jgi:type I restriction-modification system DNA methylase subunit
MATLERELRRKLEHTVRLARKTAEAGAQKAIHRLGVGEPEPPSGLNLAAQSLRLRLRAHGHQLGDRRDRRGTQSIERLTSECAYEHWHRMLFARFLAENECLIEPESGVAISLAECQELARQRNENWLTLASGFAQRMLPEIFRKDDLVLDLSLPPETRSELEDLLKDLPGETFLADDSLGWVYQYWQADKKDEVNRAETKIGADELPAVTQQFTDDYMVLFLIHNTLGAWWAGRVLAGRRDLVKSAKSEDELRRACEIGGETWTYLRFVRDPSGSWRPAAGIFPGWPKAARDITVLDPCMGSGHFLVFALPIMVAFRMSEERLPLQAAVDTVLRDNLFGLELDARCTQIAAFNLALAAWKLAGFHNLPRFNLACAGLAISASREHWLQILGREATSTVRFYFGQFYDLFKEAPTLGSLINPVRFLGRGLLDQKGQENLLTALHTVLTEDPTASPERHELGVAAEGLARAAQLLARRYTVVLTNVPYLGRGKQSEILKEHLDKYYPLGKADLATAFVLRCLEFCLEGGTAALVNPQTWLFLGTYSELRKVLLQRREWDMVARLGPGAFETISGHVVNVALLVLSAVDPADDVSMAGLDVSSTNQPDEKAAMLRGTLSAEITVLLQSEQLKNPDYRVTTELIERGTPLKKVAIPTEGLSTGDGDRFIHRFWEHSCRRSPWEYFQSAPDHEGFFGGMSQLLRWEGDGRLLASLEGARIQGHGAWGKAGVLIARVSSLRVCLYTGAKFEKNCVALTPHVVTDLDAVWTFADSAEFAPAVRRLDKKTYVTTSVFGELPFDLERWRKTAKERYPQGLPDPESDEAAQWVFHGRPENSGAPLQVAVARMTGYRWPAELDEKMPLSARAKELVRKCEDLYRFADDDGIICIPSIRGQESAADRLFAVLAACGIKTGNALDVWLRKDFFREHCELFHQVPFVWHIWDGREHDGFHALVNYHKLADGPRGRKLLESLVYRYLGDWIGRQQDGVKRGEDGAEGRLAAAQELQKRLTAVLEGDPPFDIFVRWKPIQEQPIGWEPDINDGVRLNIRPFLASDLPGGRTGAGVLRWKPNIRWGKDRGKEPERQKEDFPWFWGWDDSVDFTGGDDFTGERWNDCHYTVRFKQAARKRAQREK